MKYMGSKNRIVKHILPIMLSGREVNQWWVEPFVGGANILDKVTGKRLGGEYNEYIAQMWIELESGRVFRDNYTKEEYTYIKNNKDEDKALTGWVGIQCSYSGKWFGGYAGEVITKGGLRDYQKEAYANVAKQIPLIKGVRFVHSSFENLPIPDNSIIYCDPPYEGTTKYKDEFNHTRFWSWVRGKVEEGHTVFISEYNAPDDFICVWEKEVSSSLSANGKSGSSKKSSEKLFIHKSQLHLKP